ncbi:MAG TPA: carboxylating nicotinate-nucleotide diphosphorylase [Jatrophihabitantaceae bacterium]|jgi:nicotinate-nucleotide pyrophosphorylase (carboxylating)|nr:carboxylating nicotinate-nucleotide diphosphorylase [Jatrophihabitantaceae bacterium]
MNSDELAPGLARHVVADVVERALAEDLGAAGDVTTTATIAATAIASADLVPRQDGVVAGLPVAAYVFEAVGQGRVRVEFGSADGARVTAGEVLATVHGPVRDLLTAERTALNLIGHLSGIATLTRRWVDAIDGTRAQIRDTRKTLPGLRALEKYAVRAGGGVNHRMSLSDAALVKDNHVAAAGGVVAAFDLVRAAYPGLPLEIEVDTVQQAREVIDAGAELVLLDNMSPDDMREVVAFAAGRCRLEASGGLQLDNARAVAETGVDYLSIGALTHSAPQLDIGLDITVG